MTKRAIIYTRISQDQTGEGAGVERQEEACRQLAASRGWEVVGVESDNSISAYTGKERPAFERALTAARNGECDVIIAWDIDRLTRSIRDLLRLIDDVTDHGVGVITTQGDIDLTTSTGRMIATILAAVAAQEVEHKAARQRLANAQKAKAGGKTKGVRPFGYEADQTKILPAEAEAVRKAAKDVVAGVSLSSIAREWNEAGFTTTQRRTNPATGEKEATSWSASGVRYILTSPRYTAKRVYTPKPKDGEKAEPVTYDAAWPAILDEHTFDTVGEVLRSRGVDTRPDGLTSGGMRHMNLLAKIAVCSCHSTPVRSTTRKGPTVAGRPTTRKVYVCEDKHLVMERGLPDRWVEESILGRLEAADAAEILGSDEGSELESLQEEKVNLQARLNALVSRYMGGKITEEQFDTANDDAAARLRDVEARLATIGRATALGDLLSSADVRAAWSTLGMEQKRGVVRHLVQRIELRTDRRGLVPFEGYPDSIDLDWRDLT